MIKIDCFRLLMQETKQEKTARECKQGNRIFLLPRTVFFFYFT